MKRIIVIAVLIVAALPLLVHAQENVTQRIRDLRSEVSSLESRIQNLEWEMNRVRAEPEDAAIVLLFFAVFCAWWAQHTDRNPWLWFFLGLFLHVITAFVLLHKNSSDKRRKRATSGIQAMANRRD